MPVERQWAVPEDNQPEIGLDPNGNLLLQPRVVQDDDNDGLMEAVLEAVAIMRRVGGTIQMASQRAEIAPNVVVTESYIFAYNSFTPLVRKLHQHEVPEASPEGDEELTADEFAQHFPDGALGDAIATAQAEEPATGAENAEDELERAGTVVE